jgi:hypothetical protein
MNDELEMVWKEVAVAYFIPLSWHSTGRVEENHKNLSQDSQCPG